jgi:hypothetical protein
LIRHLSCLPVKTAVSYKDFIPVSNNPPFNQYEDDYHSQKFHIKDIPQKDLMDFWLNYRYVTFEIDVSDPQTLLEQFQTNPQFSNIAEFKEIISFTISDLNSIPPLLPFESIFTPFVKLFKKPRKAPQTLKEEVPYLCAGNTIRGKEDFISNLEDLHSILHSILHPQTDPLDKCIKFLGAYHKDLKPCHTSLNPVIETLYLFMQSLKSLPSDVKNDCQVIVDRLESYADLRAVQKIFLNKECDESIYKQLKEQFPRAEIITTS